ncbi:Peroxidase 42 [Platanthera zijinensis]|uniref:Peroxidase 42 n=1 Tax=Platanthera zijinensis TaxID=2320716 RepID=A0AAP0FU54_9ASPA
MTAPLWRSHHQADAVPVLPHLRLHGNQQRPGADYYRNLVGSWGLLHSDQELFNNGAQDAPVRQYTRNMDLFYKETPVVTVKMGSIPSSEPPAAPIVGKLTRD